MRRPAPLLRLVDCDNRHTRRSVASRLPVAVRKGSKSLRGRSLACWSQLLSIHQQQPPLIRSRFSLVCVCRIDCRLPCGTPVTFAGGPSIAQWQFAPPAAGSCALSAAERAQKASRSPRHATHRAAHRPELVHRNSDAQRRDRATLARRSRLRPRCWEFCCCAASAFPREIRPNFGHRLRATHLDASRPLLLAFAAANRTRSIDRVAPPQRLTF